MSKFNIDKNAKILITIIIIVILIIAMFNFTTLGDPIRDYFASNVEGTETVWINTTDYLPLYFNNTIWENGTIWQNFTEYIPIWYNHTEWINNTVWVNYTEIVYVPVWYNQTIWINTTTFINYPFVPGWNVSSPLSPNYIRIYQSGVNYRFYVYNQNTGTLYVTGYGSYATVLAWLNSMGGGTLSMQQRDCGYIQLKVKAEV